MIVDANAASLAFLQEDEPAWVQGHVATDVGARLSQELEALRRTRDELRVKIHLGAADARDLWERLESRYHELEGKARLVAREAEEPLHEVGEAARQLVREIREGYRRLRDAL